jgi:hypothetical protein
MANVIFGNHSSVLVSRQERDSIRIFYCDVLGGKNHEGGPGKGLRSLGRRLLHRISLWGRPR